jgi:hypothetical protein
MRDDLLTSPRSEELATQHREPKLALRLPAPLTGDRPGTQPMRLPLTAARDSFPGAARGRSRLADPFVAELVPDLLGGGRISVIR